MKSLPIVDVNADTFYSQIVKINGIIDLCNTEVVTANNSSNGATTTGKGFVIGSFGANTIVASSISGGNTIASGNLAIVTNTAITGTTVRVDNGINLGANSIVLTHGVRVVFAATTADQVADSFAASAYRSAKYVISVTDSVGSNYQCTEVLVLSDGTNTYTTEYATINSNNALATIRSDINSGNVRLLMTPLVAPVQVNISKTLVST